jgi:hypothetical protein
MVKKLSPEDQFLIDKCSQAWIEVIHSKSDRDLVGFLDKFKKGKLLSVFSHAILEWYARQVEAELLFRELGV